MAMLAIPKRFAPRYGTPKSRPIPPYVIDWRNPITRGLVRYWSAFEPIDKARGIPLTTEGAATIAAAEEGPQFQFAATADAFNAGVTPVSGSQDRTLMARTYATTSGQHYMFNINPTGGGVGTNGERWTVRIDGNTGLRCEIGGAGYTTALDANNGHHTIGVKLEGTQMGDHRYFVDGAFEDNGANTNSVSTNAAYVVRLGSLTGANNPIQGMVWAALWDRALTDEEMLSIEQDPYQILKPAVARVYFFPGPTGVSGSGTPAAQSATTAGTAEREITGDGTPAADSVTTAGIAERVLICSGTLVPASATTAGTATLQLKLLLTAAENRELRDEEGALVASLANIAYEWYEKTTDTNGDPDQSGTFNTNASGEATIQLPSTGLTPGQFGLLVLTHPTDNSIRGIYRIPVS